MLLLKLGAFYADCPLCERHLCWVTFMHSDINAQWLLYWLPFMLLLKLGIFYADCHLSCVSFMLSGIYAECHLCWVSFMLSGTNKPFMHSVFILNVVMLSVIMLRVVAPYP
jgi:hypothetical protein